MSEKWCLPSNFETGYGAEITAAVAIGAGTDEANGAAQVVSFLMSDKQVTPSGELAFSINRKVTRSLNYSLEALLPYGEEDLIDQYYDSAIDTLNDIDHINTTDYVILDCILRYLSDLMEGKISLADYSQATATLVEKALNEK